MHILQSTARGTFVERTVGVIVPVIAVDKIKCVIPKVVARVGAVVKGDRTVLNP